MHKGEISRLVGARQNVPLVVGLNGEESFIASDVAAILAHTNRVVFLEEGDVADVRPTGVESPTSTGAARARGDRRSTGRPRPPRRAATSTSCSRRSTSSPRRSASRSPGRVDARRPDPRARGASELDDVLRRVDAGRARRLRDGLYAALVGAAAHPGLDRAAGAGHGRAPSSATRRRRWTRTTLVIAVTQSGETADTIAPTRWAREQGCPIVAVTNTVGSAITREADAVLFLQAGPGDRGRRLEDVRDPGHDAHRARRGHRQGARRDGRRAGAGAGARRCGRCPMRPRGRSTQAAGSPDLARRYVNSRGFMFIGRGYGYPAALEGALKLKEVSYIHAEGYAAGELKHGPISLLDAECPLVAVATRSRIYDKLISNVMEGRARDARVIAVATEGDEAIERYADDVLLGARTRTRRCRRCSRSSRSSCSPTTRRSRGARTWTSRATSRSR